MVRSVVLLFVLLCSVWGSVSVKIAEYNVQNLFDLHYDGNEYKEYVPNGPSGWNRKNYRIKLKHTARVIKDMDADIVALCEVESLQALKDLRTTLRQMGLYYKYYAIADAKPTTVKVAVLSKIPFVYAKEVWVSRSLAYRNILELKYRLEGETFYLFVNHWKSKSGPESRRMFSARVLKKRLERLGMHNNIIVTGDFNSDYEEYLKFKRRRKLNDTNGHTGINHVLKTLHATDPAKSVRLQKEELYNLWYDLPEEERWNYIHRKKKETLDSMLVSAAVLERGGFDYRFGSFKVFRKGYLFYKKRINSWYMRYSRKGARHMGKGYSDHLPIMATFEAGAGY